MVLLRFAVIAVVGSFFTTGTLGFPRAHSEPQNRPCTPSPCGPNSECTIVAENHAACKCLPNHIGAPPNCKPECTDNLACSNQLACINQRCTDPCPGSCGANATCNTINHRPICSCTDGLTGDAFRECIPITQEKPVEVAQDVLSCAINTECPGHRACINQHCRDPCLGTCGKDATCHTINHNPICSCADGYTGDAFRQCIPIPQEKPVEVTEDHHCVNVSDCPSHLSCIKQSCRDPCPGACGINAACKTENHQPICSCTAGHAGDPFVKCSPVLQDTPVPVARSLPYDPCNPSPCGVNTECKISNENANCKCLPNFFGDPYAGCKPECVLSRDCSKHTACINQRCQDPCPGVCGTNAICQTVDHNPICSCSEGHTGDAFVKCTPITQDAPTPVARSQPHDPCYPSPCGPNALCKTVANNPTCKCLPSFIGAPPNCRPECIVSKDCPIQMACINQRCSDPCRGTCGLKATCETVNHNPICSCSEGHTGDAFVQCVSISNDLPTPVARSQPHDPCYPSPCGPNAQCKTVANNPTCKCLPSFIGAPPNCRSECIVSKDCPIQMACINQRCSDPCRGTCGLKAICETVNHNPICSCSEGHTGDAFVKCTPITQDSRATVARSQPHDPCYPSPCGPNAQCKTVANNPTCKCLPSFIGAPPNCRAECIVSKDCPTQMACINQRCSDPCRGTCGLKATCETVNHNPICSCGEGHTGDAFVKCTPISQEAPTLEARTIVDPVAPNDPCNPSPCGANTECKITNNSASCKCIHNFFGDAYVGCKPECVINSDCTTQMACINQRCQDPCPGVCGTNAICQIVNHNPTCTCSEGYTGDPFMYCMRPKPDAPTIEALTIVDPVPYNPCNPSPCGVNAQCEISNNSASCKCLPNYFGDAYLGCKPECVINSDCTTQMACINQRCQDPCPGVCGINAICQIVNHNPTCTCSEGYTGDPFLYCMRPKPDAPTIVDRTSLNSEPYDPCSPSPCGTNALCKIASDHFATCKCLPDYFGNPYEGCKPECVVNSECPKDRGCLNQRCRDPCPGVCGTNATCSTTNHIPTCTCTEGHAGDPYRECVPTPQDAPNPAVARSQPYDPCTPSPCGPNAACKNIDNNPMCSCLHNYIGAPPNCRPECASNSECPTQMACINLRCTDPCPGACGLNAICKTVNYRPVCSCSEDHTGDAFVKCIPISHDTNATVVGELSACEKNSGCPYNLACMNGKCRDPCPGVCGINATCAAFDHSPRCFCIMGHEGDPFSSCQPIPPRTPPPFIVSDPCIPFPCGPNARCNDGVCSNITEYVGVPYESCKPQCVLKSDCPSHQACQRSKCVDPCPGSCGEKAKCTVINHNPICSCPDGFQGDPFASCHLIVEPAAHLTIDPCTPSPCGPNSQCGIVNGNPICSCQNGSMGSPPNCRQECTVNTECPDNMACVNKICSDPCQGACGEKAKCNVFRHRVICSCPIGYNGDPLKSCHLTVKRAAYSIVDPCQPSPCGPNSKCGYANNNPVCSCLKGFVGSPPSCRQECTLNTDCQQSKACVDNKCADPCLGACGEGAHCEVINHGAICSCRQGQSGDPCHSCQDIPVAEAKSDTQRQHPCTPSPCGANATCKDVDDKPSCTCLPNYIGAPPYCRPECVSNEECPRNLACVSEICSDPCPGVCESHSTCHTINHTPVCSCTHGTVGYPIYQCIPAPTTSTAPPVA